MADSSNADRAGRISRRNKVMHALSKCTIGKPSHWCNRKPSRHGWRKSKGSK